MKTEQKQHGIVDVVEFCRKNNLPADIVGRWVWVSFDTKPSTEMRQLLKDYGFWWSSKRQEWAHNCGYPSRSGRCLPRVKYGAVSIEQAEVA